MTISENNANINATSADNLTAPANIITAPANTTTAPANTITAPTYANTTPAAPASPENGNSATINIVDANTAAAGISAEDTAVITEQREMINTLIEHTKSLQQQINSLMRSGASITDGTAQPGTQQQAKQEDTSEPYVTFAELGREMGNRRYENKNMEGD